MARVLTNDELIKIRKPGQFSQLYLAVHNASTVYSARLNGAPASTDKVAQINYDGGSGTLANVKVGMTILVGTSAGASDLGKARVRKAPTSSIFYIGEQSQINWEDNCYLTVINDITIWPRHIYMDGTTPYIDYDVAYSNQHSTFDPVPVLGPGAVAKLVGGSAIVQLGPETGTSSWVFGSSISTYLWSIPTASAISNTAIASPTATFTTVGWHAAYCTVTAANGKSTQGVRYIYIYDDDNMPFSVGELIDFQEDVADGGISFSVELFEDGTNAIASIREGALAILFSVDNFGNIEDSETGGVGPISGRENIRGIGRIVDESIRYNDEFGSVTFQIGGFQALMKKLGTFPVGLRYAATATSWVEMPSLTVDRAIWHLMHWRTNGTQVMDFIRTEDTRLAQSLRSSGSNMWSQLEELSFDVIMANPMVDQYGRLFIQVDGQIVPTADRAAEIPEVMTLTKSDVVNDISLQRRIQTEVSKLYLSGISYDGDVDTVETWYSLAPGHVHAYYGDFDIVDRLLLDDQTQANDLAAMIWAWRNNQYPSLSVTLISGHNGISCIPAQYVNFDIEVTDTPRAIAVSKRWLIRTRTMEYDPDTGVITTALELEAETSADEAIAIDGDIPSEETFDPGQVPSLQLPKLPSFPIILPIDIGGAGSTEGANRVILHDPVFGLVYTANFRDSSPTWEAINSGLTSGQYQSINRIVACPNGSIYVTNSSLHYGSNPDPFIAWAPAPGSPFTILEDYTSIEAEHGTTGAVLCIARDRSQADRVAYVIGGDSNRHIYIGNGSGGFTKKTAIATLAGNQRYSSLSFSPTTNSWIFTGNNTDFFTTFRWFKIAGDGSSVLLSSQDWSSTSRRSNFHFRAGKTDILWTHSAGGEINLSTDNLATTGPNLGAGSILDYSDDKCHFAVDGTGQYLIARYMPLSGSGGRGKSSDYGSSWTTMGSLPYIGNNWRFAYLGGVGVSSKWGAAGGTSIRRSPDFGTTWENREGNAIADFPLSTWDYMIALDEVYE